MFFLNRNKDILNKLTVFFNISENILKEFLKALTYVCKNGLDSHFETMAEKISEMEKDADIVRREIEYQMISKSLLPETREDLLGIIHLMDNIPDHCEKVAYIFNDQKILPYESIKKELIELTKIGIKCFDNTLKTAYDFLHQRKNMKAFIQKVDDLEHIGDKLERKMIQEIFSSRIGTGKKIIQKQIITEVGEICDISKQVTMRIFVSSVKRKI